MENNKAFVAYLRNIQPIDGADKIKQADVVLNDIKITQVVVGVDTVENTKIVYFDSNMVLSDVILNDYPELDTYLSKHRVRVIKLRGVISNGLAVEVEKFYKYAKPDFFSEGVSFTELNGKPICSKYLPPVKQSTQPKGKKGRTPKVSRMIPGQFHFHIDTDQLLRNVHKLNHDSVISITRKIHGTSAIASNCLVKRKKSLMEKLTFWIDSPGVHYDMVYASRSVIKNDSLDSGFYGYDIWKDAGQKHFDGKLFNGETVYYEIVGFLPSGSAIQKGYDYGCKPGEYKIAVYRITKTGPDGHIVEYCWQAIKERCKELSVDHVQEYYFGRASSKYIIEDDNWNQQFVKALQNEYLEKICHDCQGKKADEGIVLRVESLGIEVYKLKSELFLLGESKASDDGDENLEDTQDAT